MRKMFAVSLAAAVISSVWMAGTLQAEETEAPEQALTEESAGIGAEPVEIPETRPEYTASDYVQIRDEKYKGIDDLLLSFKEARAS